MGPSSINNILMLVIVIGAAVLPFILATRLRRTKPGVLWLGLLLCIIFGPAGQVYVAGWIPWFLIVLGVCIGAQQLLSPQLAMLCMVVVSPLVMFFRMRK